MEQRAHTRVGQHVVGRPLEALGIGARDDPVGVLLDFGEIAVDVERQVGGRSGLDHAHPLQHLDGESADDGPARALVDEAVEGRADDVGEKAPGEAHAVDGHHRRPTAGRRHCGTDPGQAGAADQHVGFGDHGEGLRVLDARHGAPSH